MSTQTLLDILDHDIEIAQDVEFATEIIPCPEGEFPAEITKITRRSFTGKDGNSYFMLNIRWGVDDEEAREITKMDKVFVDQSMFLRLDEEKCYNMDADDANNQLWVLDKDINPEFGRFKKWLESTGWKMPSSWVKFWTQLSDDIVGKEALIKVKHFLRKRTETDEDGEEIIATSVQANVTAVAKI